MEFDFGKTAPVERVLLREQSGPQLGDNFGLSGLADADSDPGLEIN